MEVSHVNFGKLQVNDVDERSVIIIFQVSDYFLTDPTIYNSKGAYAKFSVQLCFRGL